MNEGKELYHVCTDGMSRSLMFRDDDDYISGMNAIPVCMLTSGVKIYCFCLMSNHVHFVLSGEEDKCLSFIRTYKRLGSTRIFRKYGIRPKVRRTAPDLVKKIEDNEYFLNVMAYVMRNPLSAGISVMPSFYTWSSTQLYFRPRNILEKKYRKVSEFGTVELRRIVKSRFRFPGDYLICDEGLIWPGSYVDWRYVEKAYGSPRRLLYFLSRNQDMEIGMESGIISRSKYSDSEIASSIESICRQLFPGFCPDELGIEDRYRLAKELRRRYGASAKQLGRITGLDSEILKELL